MLFEKEEFNTKLISALSECGFLFSAKDFIENEDLKQENLRRTKGLIKKTELWYKVSTKIVIPVIETSLDFSIPSNKFRTSAKIEFDFNSRGVQESITKIRNDVDLVCFKYCYSQPVIVAIVEADSLNGDDKKRIFDKFDQAMNAFREFTSSMKVNFANIKMSVTGIILWNFFNADFAQTFSTDMQNELRKMHFWKKVNTLSWVIDVKRSEIRKHSGLPLIVNSVFDVDRFKRYLFM
ncbi:MAG: hypothetical protein Fur006_29430 [Coleofasciculaceae cyanobacterium]